MEQFASHVEFFCSSPSDSRYLSTYHPFWLVSFPGHVSPAYLVLFVELSRTIVAVNLNFFSRKKMLGLKALELQNSEAKLE